MHTLSSDDAKFHDLGDTIRREEHTFIIMYSMAGYDCLKASVACKQSVIFNHRERQLVRGACQSIKCVSRLGFQGQINIEEQ